MTLNPYHQPFMVYMDTISSDPPIVKMTKSAIVWTAGRQNFQQQKKQQLTACQTAQRSDTQNPK